MNTGEPPAPARTGPQETTAPRKSSGHEPSFGRRQNLRLELLSQLGRLVLDGPAPAAQRLAVAADEAAALVAEGQLARSCAVTALYTAAMAAGIGGVTALAAISAAFCRAGTP